MNWPACDNPWLLLLAGFAVLPWLRSRSIAHASGSVSHMPMDKLATRLLMLSNTLASLAIIAMALGIAGLHKPAHQVDRVGTGAHVVLLIDRSRSMDQPFATERNAMVGAAVAGFESKGRIARRVLSEFVSNRTNDMFAMVAFSTFPIPVLPLTGKQAIVQGAISSGDFGRGLSQTNMAAGLERALEYFTNEPYTGSRIVLLVSDGAAHIDGVTRRDLTELLEVSRASLYWIYIRSRNGPTLFGEDEDYSPERSLHDFFAATGAPYRAYTAESSSDLKRAVNDVNRLQNLPLHYAEQIPRLPLQHIYFLIAACCLLPLLFLRATEVRQW